MQHRRFLLLVLLGCALPSSAFAQLVQVSYKPLPDPHVIREGTHWYIFGTSTKPHFFLQGRSLNKEAMKPHELTFDFGPYANRVRDMWGFTVHKHTDGTFHGYGTLHFGYFETVVAHFLPRLDQTWQDGRPITSWQFNDVLIGDPSQKNQHYYEAKIITDADGAMYLVYVGQVGPNQNAILAQRMLGPAQLDRRYAPRVLLRPEGFRSEDRNHPGGLQLVEGASIIELQGTFVLLYSVGDFLLANYKLGVAFSERLIPKDGKTYTKVLIADTKNLWKNSNQKRRKEVQYLLQSESREWPNYCGQLVFGPGLGSIHRIDEEYWLVFHGYRPADKRRKGGMRNPQHRFVWRLPIEIQISNKVPMRDWVRIQIPRQAPR